MTEKPDALIIGGGIVGVSIAHFLAARGYGHILLLERDALAGGGTGRSVASLDHLTFHPPSVRLYARTAEVFLNSREMLGEDCGYEVTGSVMMAAPEQADSLEKAVEQMQAAGVDVQFSDIEALDEFEPAAVPDGLAAFSFAPKAGYADPAMATQAFAASAKRQGVSFRIGQEVLGITSADSKPLQVQTNRGLIESPVVVVAAGAWSGRVLQFAGAELGLQPVRHPVVSFKRPGDFGKAHHSIIDLPGGIYARPETGGLTLLGSLDTKMGYDPADPDDDHGGVPNDYTWWAIERMIARYPSLERSVLDNGWSGMMMVSPDWKPVIGEIAESPGLYCATGFSGQGFQISAGVGDFLAGMIAGDKEAAAILGAFHPSRFAEDGAESSDDRTDELGLFG